MAVAALQAADEYFKESKKACEAFNVAPPLSRYSTNGIILFFFPLYFNCRGSFSLIYKKLIILLKH